MKKVILSVILVISAVFTVFAQTPSNLSKAAKFAYDWLVQEGYRPSIDGDGDVLFKANGYSMYVFDIPSDPEYLRIYCGGIKSIDMDGQDVIFQSYVAYKTCNNINEKYKLVKSYMTNSGSVCLEVQSYIDENPGETSLETSIEFILRCINHWKDEFNSLISD